LVAQGRTVVTPSENVHHFLGPDVVVFLVGVLDSLSLFFSVGGNKPDLDIPPVACLGFLFFSKASSSSRILASGRGARLHPDLWSARLIGIGADFFPFSPRWFVFQKRSFVFAAFAEEEPSC